MHERFKTVEVAGREYIIEKFDAMTALKLARFLLSKIAPLLPALLREDGEVNEYLVYEVLGEILGTVEDDELERVVCHCLRACSANLPGGRQPVMDEFGHFSVDDVEHDAMLVAKLCGHALMFGVADFFSGSPLLRQSPPSPSSP